MAGKIFLNYRRDDDAGTVGRLFDRLENAFGKSNIFMDVEGHIKAGDDYVDVLRAQVDACDVLLAVIGPRWLTITDDNDRRRLDNPDDWVRIEIAKALEAGISKRVIPVLAPAGAMPRAGDLPADLAALARKQAVRITLDRFNSDAQGLIDQIRGVLDDLETAKAASEAERAAAEAAQRKRESEEQAKQEAIEARARAWLISGLSPEEVRKAEELANWDYVKARADIDEVRDHLARFPDSVITKPYAQARLAELTWSRLTARSAIEELRAFVEAFPTSEHCAEAQHWIESAEARVADERASAERRAAETEAWSAVASSTDKAVIEAFIRAWPNGAHAGHAQARLKELRGNLGGSHILVRALAYASVVTIVAGALIFLGQPVWQLASVQSLPTLIGHPCCVSSVVFAPDGKTALSATHSGVMKVWDIATRKELRTFSAHGARIDSVVVAPDGKTAISGSTDEPYARLWDIATGEKLRDFSHSSNVGSLAFAPDGKAVLVGAVDGTLRLWDLATGKELRSFARHGRAVRALAFSADGKMALSGGGDSILKLWDVAAGRQLRSFEAGSWWTKILAFAVDGKTVVSVSDTNGSHYIVRVWDLATGKAQNTIEFPSAMNATALAPDGKTLLSLSDDKLAQWEVHTGKELRNRKNSCGWFGSIAFSPDGKMGLVGCHDGSLRLWQLVP